MQSVTKTLDNIDQIYDKDGKFLGYLRRTSIAPEQEKNICIAPNPSEADPIKKITDEQHYMICRFGSLKNLMNDLQIAMFKEGYKTAATSIRCAMREMQVAHDNYLLVSRRRVKTAGKNSD